MRPDDVPPPERGPLFSMEAEQSVLGALLLDNRAFDEVAELISAADFYAADHGQIFTAIALLTAAGTVADQLTVHEWMQAREIRVDDSLVYLTSLANNTPGAASAPAYARIVRERSLRRTLIRAAHSIIESAQAPNGQPIDALIDQAQARVLAIAESNTRGRAEFPPLADFLNEAVARIQELSERESDNDVIGLPTGFTELDRKTAGLCGGDLVIVAARPAMGKTALAMNIAEHVALSERTGVAVFSLEMPGAQLAVRMMASVAGLNQHRVRRGRLNRDEWERLAGAVERIRGARIHVDESPLVGPNELRARCRRLFRAMKGNLGLVIVDYLQLMEGSNAHENRTNQIGEISRALKLLAKELDVPVIALSQLNRELEKRGNKRPMMSDLRDSGAIEQDADVILFIYRDEVYDAKSEHAGEAEIIIAKQRNGPVGTVRLAFHAENTRFANLAGEAY